MNTIVIGSRVKVIYKEMKDKDDFVENVLFIKIIVFK